MTAIATALDVTEETVLLAAGASLGLKTGTRSRLVMLIPDRAAELSDQCVAAVVNLVRALCAIQDAV
ncbi:hypothetical protein [Nocardia sp. NPDC005745]|uniref:hypothetical protein n=1 Tax=Nocardia sp. NPDC005745 TaxID=3157061 RepID=UPI0033D43CA8